MSRRFSLVLFAVALLGLPANSQVGPHLERGLKPFGSFQGGNIDSVSMTNGNLTLRIPFWSYPQRGGVRVNYFIVYNNKNFGWKETCNFLGECTTRVTFTPYQTSVSVSLFKDQGLTLKSDIIQADQFTTFTVYSAIEPDETRHQLAETTTAGIYRAIDGSGILYDKNSGVLIDRSGVRYTTQIQDPNGNYLSGAVDTLGRTIPSSTSTTTDYSGCKGPRTIVSATIMNMPAPSGGNAPVKFCYVKVPLKTAFAVTDIEFSVSQGPNILQAIILPYANGTFDANSPAWVFDYGPEVPPTVQYGDLRKITFPTGGSISYTWSTQPFGGSLEVSRAVSTRTVDANDGSGPKTWTYSWFADPNAHPVSTHVATDPLGNDTVYSISNLAVIVGNNSFETERKHYQGSRTGGTLLKTVQTAYTWTTDPIAQWLGANGSVANVVPIRTTTIWPNGQQSKVERDYDGGFTFKQPHPNWPPAYYTGTFGNALAEREHDYGLVLARKKETAYLALSNSNYLTHNLIDLVSSVTIRNGAGTQVAQTLFGYDALALQPSGVTTQRNASPPNGSYRGNLTSVSRWLNTTGGYVTSTTQYYDTGLPYLQSDPQSHNTTVEYSLTYGGAYATKVTNHLGHFATSAYDFNTGLLTSSTDPNSKTTSFTYDHLSRSDVTDYPDGGQVNLDYTSAPPFKVTANVKLDTAPTYLVGESEVDGLGRQRYSRLLTDPQGTVITETTYDALGRKASVSNPYRSVSDPTFGWTRFCYDALGRTRKVTPPDGTAPATDCSGGSNLVTTDYSGNQTTVTDQAGKQRRSYADALGRLIQVDEPNPTLSTPAVTTYTYDTLDNLTGVLQSGSRQRTFAYNSLSQLLSATNPESGTTTYVYDNDGNLVGKQDARGSSSYITMYYDALHRLTDKLYNDGTPAMHFTYDVPPVWMTDLTNTTGRLTVAYNQFAGASGTSTAWAMTNSYDSMGRIVRQWQQTPSVSPGGSFTYMEYDKAGNLTWLTYPSGRKVTYGYNTASQLNRVTFDSWNGTPVNYNYLTTTSDMYHPHGAAKVWTLGNGFTETNTYNNRLQPLQMTGAAGGATYYNKTYGFNAGTANNGNVAGITDNLNAGRTQSFSYDHLNRLLGAQTGATSGADCWGYDYGYDVWANLLSMSKKSSHGTCTGGALSQTVLTDNRISGLSYDAAGNQLGNGVDTYQWDAESRLKSLNTSGATYTYDANDLRVRKQSSSETIEYIYFGGQVVAERNVTNGEWSDYIYAGGRRLAKGDNYEDRIRTYGNRCASCGPQWDYFQIPSSFSTGYVVQAGDKLYVRQWQTAGTRAGILMWFTDGSHSGSVNDQDGWPMYIDGVSQQWHYRRFDLTPHAGKTLYYIEYATGGESSPGDWSAYYQDVAIVGANGSVRTLYSREKTVTLYSGGQTGSTRGYEVNHVPGSLNPGQWPIVTTTYYHGDHLGSSRMMTAYEGYPVWEGTYRPYGEEHAAQPTVNNYKFTGKERDPESALDYFGARYFGAAVGRFLSPDPGPFHFDNPQSWNRYTYVMNNPLFFIDPDGLDSMSAVYRLGSANFVHFVPTGQMFDAGALIIKPGSIAHKPLADLKPNQSMATEKEGDAGGGCGFGCTGVFREVPFAVEIQVSFSYDESGKISGANISLIENPNATFLMPRQTPTRAAQIAHPSMGLAPENRGTSIDPSTLRRMTNEQLNALADTASTGPRSSSAVYRAIVQAALNELRRRAEEERRRNEASKQGPKPKKPSGK